MIRASAIIPAAIWAILGTAAWARPISSVMATAKAVVVEDLSISGKEPLDFGFITPSPLGGTVTVSFDRRRYETGGVHASSSFSSGVFTVRGMQGHNYTIHTPSSITFMVRNRLTDNISRHLVRELAVNNFTTYSATLQAEGTTGRLDRNGRDKVYLGATLTVPANAAPGIYSGWVPLTVSY